MRVLVRAWLARVRYVHVTSDTTWLYKLSNSIISPCWTPAGRKDKGESLRTIFIAEF